MSGVVLSTRVSRLKRALIEDLAQERGITSAEWLRATIDEALERTAPQFKGIIQGGKRPEPENA